MARASILGSICLILGACLGWMLKPSSYQSAPVQVETKQAQVKVVTRTVTKTVKPDGTVVVKEVEKASVKSKTASKTKPLPKPDYRVGVQTGIDLKPTVTAGRRLFGNVWIDSAFKPSSKDVTIGLSYEF